MKRRITTLLLAMLLVVCTAIGLSACDKECKHEYGEWTETKAATCTENGEQSRTCTKCGNETKESISALGHDMQAVSAKAPTCESAGWEAYEQCSRCDHNTKQEIAALGHEFSENWTNDESGHWHLCTHNGCGAKSNEGTHSERDHYCSVCDYKISEHEYGEVTYIWLDDYTVCRATRYCSKCSADTEGQTQTANATISTTVKQNATCLLPELTTYTATFAEDWATTQTKENVQSNAALGHKKGETWQSDTLYHWKKCENEGCSQQLDKAEHTYSDDTYTCSCGYQAQGLVVTYSEEDGGYTVVGYCGDDTEITIPFTYNAEPYGEKPIVSIANILDSENNTISYKKLTKIVLSEGIKSIGTKAFFKCDKLSSVIIPSTVTEIGNGALSYCTALTAINLPEGIIKIGISAFMNSGLTEIVVPKTVTYLGGSSFSDCNQLETITLPFIGTDKNNSNTFSYIFAMVSGDEGYKYVPKSLKTVIISENVNVKNSAFYNCTGLQNVIFEKGVSGISSNAFYGCSSLIKIDLSSSSLTEIPSDAFKGCASLSEIKLPSGLTTIGDGAFDSCTNLTTVNLPESLTTIKTSAFVGCTALSEIEFPNGLTTIQSTVFKNSGLTKIDLSSCALTEISVGAFEYCTSLSDVKLPSVLISINNTAFCGCSSLQSITLPNGLTEIKPGAFSECALTSIEFPDSLRKIGSTAFGNCKSLTEVVIPDTVTEIGKYPFDGCTNVTKITLPWIVDYVGYIFGATTPNANKYYTQKLSEVVITNGETISSKAFYGCSALTSITLPSTLKSIGEESFLECNALKTVRFAGTMGEWCGISFNGTNNATSPLYFSKSLYLKDANGEYQKVTHAVIPEGVTSIGKNFEFNEAITSITIPASVKNVSYNAFYGCENLVNVYYDGSVEDYCGIEYSVNSYGECEYSNPMYGSVKEKTFYMKNSDGSYQKPTSIIIPETVTKIGSYQFRGFKQITSITISSSVTSIGRSAFSMCDGLKNITIPDSVVSIDAYAFNYCYYLESVEISASVKSIGKNAFGNCKNLKTINFKGTQAEWEAIEIDDDWNEDASSSLEIVCTDGKISFSE